MSMLTETIEDSKNSEEPCQENVEEQTEIKSEAQSITHKRLVDLTNDAIFNILQSDPMLSDLPPNPTAEEIRAQKAVAEGQAITLFIERGALPTLPIVVPIKSTSIAEVKKAVKRATNLAMERTGVTYKISWKSVWKRYWLSFEGLKLMNDFDNIDSYGITNKSRLRFVKRKTEKKSK
ncbi:U11/U12 small nuclear ribonucleoprotein 25 kDa protein [Trichogramma pretiosum]|uniref:U11/U12 small nuclear ribonucleoprotein 25 kDa protein n=1 Tax=Trichogramma pretiosum TaxID=7493 RepID=UPI0006C9B292|nr:U11/U12 small nuclear ribonucleoprotein 25 kDa protein [Trichogramma pretiosum]